MIGIDFLQSSTEEKIITISILVGMLVIAFIAERIEKWQQKKNISKR